MKKILTVVIPAYNMENYLQRCCESVLVKDRSLREQLEVIVVNDGSKDRTLEVARHFADVAPETFVVVDKPNGNYGSCVNVGISMAKGVYFRVLDADDYFDVNVFESYLRFLLHFDEENRSDMIVSDYAHITQDGRIAKACKYNIAIDSVLRLSKMPDNMEFKQHAITYKLAVLRNIDYRQTEGISYTDTEYITEPVAVVDSVVYFNEVLTYYQVGRDGQTMKPETYAKNFWMMIQIACNVVSHYPGMVKCAALDAVDYYERRVKELVRECYYTGIFGHKNIAVEVDLRPLDSVLASNAPELWKWSDELKFPFPLFPIRYVHAYRNGRAWQLAIARLIRSVCRTLLRKSNTLGE